MTELTILMPCRNEAASVEYCVRAARSYLTDRGISGQVLVVDNGSTDGSGDLARASGAEVVTVEEKGYGNALIGGIAAAKGRYIIMGDCDGSYDFSHLDGLLEKLREGWHMVVGNRFRGGIQSGAMPFSHRYFGVPLLSFLGRLRFRVDVGDFHCGLRGISREAAEGLCLRCGGMEFATEIIGRFADGGRRLCQVPVALHRDLRGCSGHLRTVADGMRHIKLLLFWEKESPVAQGKQTEIL